MDDTLKDILIPPNLEGERLDKALATLDGALSRSTLQRLIRQGHITLNQQPVVDISLKVKAGSLFQIGIPAPQPATALPEEIPLHIVHEDAHVVVINKPPGLAVHPGAGLPSGTLVNALLHHCDALSQLPSLTGIGGIIRPGVVHRLDKDTSGLLVVAKNDHAHLHLAAQFKEHSVTRRYLAILVGIPKHS
ncbi:MAG: RluA family pseudouridine synthase, partial [Magnetococcales bacterium]|nr:RluA family pseudouridine synthase [Magnetococcales bacterium]NGZ27270.1 RluA family pseudouridine synthase [Magnetococcales bacterium]